MQAPCQHNFCLGCFNRWVGQGKKTCPTCRHAFPAKFAANPRINTLLASAIRMAKLGDRPAAKFVMVSCLPSRGTCQVQSARGRFSLVYTHLLSGAPRYCQCRGMRTLHNPVSA